MHNTYFPAMHSILSASALLSYAQEHYEIGDAIEGRFLNPGLNMAIFMAEMLISLQTSR